MLTLDSGMLELRWGNLESHGLGKFEFQGLLLDFCNQF